MHRLCTRDVREWADVCLKLRSSAVMSFLQGYDIAPWKPASNTSWLEWQVSLLRADDDP
jgi:hypothetical protein